MDNRTEPVTDGVWRIEVGAFTNAYLLADDGHGDDGELTLVDAGPAGAGPGLVRSIRLLGFDPRAVGHLLVTHWHVRHAGSAARFAASSAAAVVYARPPDLEVLPRGDGIRDQLVQGLVVRRPAAGGGSRRGVDEAVALRDGEILDVAGGLEVVATPGHTAGHTSFLLRDAGVLFCGDTLATVPLPNTMAVLSEDRAELAGSLSRLASLRPEVLAPGHGQLLRTGAAARLDRLATRVSPRSRS